MIHHEIEQRDKDIFGWIKAEAAKLLPRQATVTRPENSGVWVRFIGEGTGVPESWFPSTISGVPAGTKGWVVTLAGKKGLFVATGQRYYTQGELDAMLAALGPRIYQIEPYTNSGDPRSTTSISEGGEYWWDGAATGIARRISLQPGQWQIDVTGSAKLRRSVTTGGATLVLNVDGVRSVSMDYQSQPRDQYHFWQHAERFTVNVSSPRTIDIRIGLRGWNTAGTTWGYRPVLNGTYQRIG